MRRFLHLRTTRLLGLLLPMLLMVSGGLSANATYLHARHTRPLHRVLRSSARAGEQLTVEANDSQLVQAGIESVAPAHVVASHVHGNKVQAGKQLLPAIAVVRWPLFEGGPTPLARSGIDGDSATPPIFFQAPRGPPSLL